MTGNTRPAPFMEMGWALQRVMGFGTGGLEPGDELGTSQYESHPYQAVPTAATPLLLAPWAATPVHDGYPLY